MTRACWLRSAVMNRHRYAIEQAPRRWRRGRRDDSARTRRKILIFTQVTPLADPTRSFTKALDLEMEGTPPQLGYVRSKRFAAVFDDGKYHMPSDATFVSNHYVKISVQIHAIDTTPARWRTRRTD